MNLALLVCLFVCLFARQNLRNSVSVFSVFVHEVSESSSQKSDRTQFLNKSANRPGGPKKSKKMKFWVFGKNINDSCVFVLLEGESTYAHLKTHI